MLKEIKKFFGSFMTDAVVDTEAEENAEVDVEETEIDLEAAEVLEQEECAEEVKLEIKEPEAPEDDFEEIEIEADGQETIPADSLETQKRKGRRKKGRRDRRAENVRLAEQAKRDKLTEVFRNVSVTLKTTVNEFANMLSDDVEEALDAMLVVELASEQVVLEVGDSIVDYQSLCKLIKEHGYEFLRHRAPENSEQLTYYIKLRENKVCVIEAVSNYVCCFITDVRKVSFGMLYEVAIPEVKKKLIEVNEKRK